MPRKCKCKYTGEWGDVEHFIKTESGYFKDNEAYQEWLVEEEKREQMKVMRNKIVNIIAFDFLGCPEGTPPPRMIFKKIQDLKGYGYDAILETIRLKYNDIKWVSTYKTFDSTQHHIAYIFAIISNNILDSYKKLKLEKEREARKKKLQEQPDLNAEMIVEDINVGGDTPKVINKNTNLKKYLEEGDDY